MNPDSVVSTISNKNTCDEGILNGGMTVERSLDVSVIAAEPMSMIRNTRKACFSLKKRPKYR